MHFALRSAFCAQDDRAVSLSPFPFRTRPSGHYYGRDSSSGTEIALYFGPDWFCPAHHVFQHTIHNVLLEDSQVAITLQIFLQGFQLETMLVRHVADGHGAEIGQAGLGTHRGKLRVVT